MIKGGSRTAGGGVGPTLCMTGQLTCSMINGLEGNSVLCIKGDDPHICSLHITVLI